MNAKTIKLRYKRFIALDATTHDLNLELNTDSRHLYLKKGVARADEMGNCNSWAVEAVSRTEWIQLDFWINNPVTDGAVLQPYINRSYALLH